MPDQVPSEHRLLVGARQPVVQPGQAVDVVAGLEVTWAIGCPPTNDVGSSSRLRVAWRCALSRSPRSWAAIPRNPISIASSPTTSRLRLIRRSASSGPSGSVPIMSRNRRDMQSHQVTRVLVVVGQPPRLRGPTPVLDRLGDGVTNDRSQSCCCLPPRAAATSTSTSNGAPMNTAHSAAVARPTANPGSCSTTSCSSSTSPDRRCW